MAKVRYVCTRCGQESLKWMGRCAGCGEWNTIEEYLPSPTAPEKGIGDGSGPQVLNHLRGERLPRLSTGSRELDRLLGGGLVPGSLSLCAGDPGIGKSTLALLLAGRLAASGPVLYVSGEESEAQTKMRADRLGTFPDTLYAVSETRLDRIEGYIQGLQPLLVIIDSIQTVYLPEVKAAPGTVTQIKEATAFLLRMAKRSHIAFFIIGQVTKDSVLAGPRLLEHMVDTVLSFEGNRNHPLRMVRAVKNRFGATDETALLEMREQGLVEVEDPSFYLLEGRNEGVPGTAVVASGRGHRPLYYELEALVTPVPEGVPPRHTAVGVSRNRLELVAAVLQRHTPYRVAFRSLFVSLAGGFETDDPALDLGIAVALASSESGMLVPPGTVWIGEVTLTGEVRPVPDLGRLVGEAERLGFSQVVLSDRGLDRLPLQRRLRLLPVRRLGDALARLGGMPT